MDSMRNLNTTLPGTSPSKQATPQEAPPEQQLLNAFRAAALNVTKLYKTAASTQSRARQEGYRECLDDLLAFLDKEDIGLGDGEGWRIRSWATERLDGEGMMQAGESEDEVDRAETASSGSRNEGGQGRVDSAPPSVPPIIEEPIHITVPTQEHFTFQSAVPYPQQDASLSVANLDLSDTRSQETPAATLNPGPTTFPSRQPRSRHGGRSGSRLGRGAGQKRKINFDEIFGLGSMGYGKDMFGGNGNKKNRHA